MQIQFYVSHNAKDLGPFTRDQIQRKVELNELSRMDYVYIEEKEDWILVDEFLKTKAVELLDDENSFAVTVTEHESQPKKFESPFKSSPVQKQSVAQKQNVQNEKKEVESISISDWDKSIVSLDRKVAIVDRSEIGDKSTVQTQNSIVRAEKGEAKLSLHNQAVGVLSVAVESKKPGLALESKIDIVFTPGDANQIQIEGPDKVQVAHAAKFIFKAVDIYGNLDTKFNDVIHVKCSVPLEGLSAVNMLNGMGTCQLKWTKVETVDVTFEIQSKRKVEFKKSHRIHFECGPAVKILIESTKEARVGDEVFVTVKAVDAYGNLDTNFNETLSLKLSGIQSKETEVALQRGTAIFKVS